MNTLKTMQTLAQMQSEVRDRRLRMAEENLAHQKLIQQKHAKELARLEHEKSHVILLAFKPFFSFWSSSFWLSLSDQKL